jgi:hypothetical protein
VILGRSTVVSAAGVSDTDVSDTDVSDTDVEHAATNVESATTTRHARRLLLCTSAIYAVF